MIENDEPFDIINDTTDPLYLYIYTLYLFRRECIWTSATTLWNRPKPFCSIVMFRSSSIGVWGRLSESRKSQSGDGEQVSSSDSRVVPLQTHSVSEVPQVVHFNRWMFHRISARRCLWTPSGWKSSSWPGLLDFTSGFLFWKVFWWSEVVTVMKRRDD